MADAIYPKFKEEALQGNVDLATSNVKAVLIDTADYTYSGSDQYLSDVAAGAREETSGNLTTKTFTDGGFNADDVEFLNTSGDTCEAVIIYIDTGSASTSNLVCYLDSLSGLPVNLGGDVGITWDTNIFTI